MYRKDLKNWALRALIWMKMLKTPFFFLFLLILVSSCGGGDDYTYEPIPTEIPSGDDNDDDGADDDVDDNDDNDTPTITDEELLDLTQEETFKYFWDFAEENSGGARERYHPDDPSSGDRWWHRLWPYGHFGGDRTGFYFQDRRCGTIDDPYGFSGKCRSFSWCMAPLDQWVKWLCDSV